MMNPSDKPDWLPPGWIVHSRLLKSGHETRYYANLESGRMFSSKEEVLEYDTGCKVVSKRTLDDDLPPGWIKEIKVTNHGHKSRRDAYYTDPVSGYVFQSRRDVQRYLETGKMSKRARLPKQRQTNNQNLSLHYANLETCQMFSSEEEVLEYNTERKVISKRTLDDDLPPGWIKEIKVTHHGHKSRKDTYYTDPISGYVFQSRVDVERYLETGKMSKRACLPRKIQTNNHMLSLPSSEDQKHNVEERATKIQLFKGEGDECISSVSPAEVEAHGQHDMVTVQGRLVVSPTVEALPESPIGKPVEIGVETKPSYTLHMSKDEHTNRNNISSGLIPVSESLTDKLSIQQPSSQGEKQRVEDHSTTRQLFEGNDDERTSNIPLIDFELPKQDQDGMVSVESSAVGKVVETVDETKANSSLYLSKNEVIQKSIISAKLPEKVSLESGLKKIGGIVIKTMDLNYTPNENLPSYNCKDPLQDQPTLIETSLISDDKSETPIFLPFGDSSLDPCLEFAYKTLTGAISLDDIANDGTISTPVAADIMLEGNFHVSKVDNGKTKKELKFPCESSKVNNSACCVIPIDDIVNNGEIPTLVANNVSKVGRNITCKAQKSQKDELKLPHKSIREFFKDATDQVENCISSAGTRGAKLDVDFALVNEACQYPRASLKARTAHYNSSKVNARNSSLPPATRNDPTRKHQEIENAKIHNKQTYQQSSFPFGDNNLLDNTSTQSKVQQQVVTSGVGQNSNLSLPVFGMPYLPKCDLPPFFHSSEKQSASSRQQFPLNFSSLPPTNVSNSNQEICGKEESQCNRGSK